MVETLVKTKKVYTAVFILVTVLIALNMFITKPVFCESMITPKQNIEIIGDINTKDVKEQPKESLWSRIKNKVKGVFHKKDSSKNKVKAPKKKITYNKSSDSGQNRYFSTRRGHTLKAARIETTGETETVKKDDTSGVQKKSFFRKMKDKIKGVFHKKDKDPQDDRGDAVSKNDTNKGNMTDNSPKDKSVMEQKPTVKKIEKRKKKRFFHFLRASKKKEMPVKAKIGVVSECKSNENYCALMYAESLYGEEKLGIGIDSIKRYIKYMYRSSIDDMDYPITVGAGELLNIAGDNVLEARRTLERIRANKVDRETYVDMYMKKTDESYRNKEYEKAIYYANAVLYLDEKETTAQKYIDKSNAEEESLVNKIKKEIEESLDSNNENPKKEKK